MRLVGLDRNYTYQEIDQIPQQWQEFDPYIGNIAGQVGGVTFGLVHSLTDGAFRYLSGVEVSEEATVASELVSNALAAQRYVVFEHREHLSRISETVNAIWREWLPRQGMPTIDSPYMLERYGESFDAESGYGDIELWIAVRN